MKIPRPPGWNTNPTILRLRARWHWHGLPCPFCRIERGHW